LSCPSVVLKVSGRERREFESSKQCSLDGWDKCWLNFVEE